MASEVKVFVLPKGQLQIFVDNATDDEAVRIINAVLSQLQQVGVPLSDIGEIEFHRKGGEHVHVISEVRVEH